MRLRRSSLRLSNGLASDSAALGLRLLHHDVHELARNHDGLHDGLAVHELLDAVIFHGELLKFGLVHVLGDRCLGADLAVHLENDFHGGFFGFGSVGFGPGDVREGFVVTEDAPHFFGDVRSERLQKKGKYFAGFAVAIGGFEKFVVETQLFNRIGYLDDALVHDLFDCFRSGLRSRPTS